MATGQGCRALSNGCGEGVLKRRISMRSSSSTRKKEEERRRRREEKKNDNNNKHK